MIADKTIHTTIKPVTKLAYCLNGQTAMRCSRQTYCWLYGHTTNKRMGCTVECLYLGAANQAMVKSIVYMYGELNRQLTACTAISIT